MLRAPPTREPNVMAETRKELKEMLPGLEADMPWLQKAYPDQSDFIHAFVDQADLIIETVANAKDDAWVSAQINRILIKFGHVNDIAL